MPICATASSRVLDKLSSRPLCATVGRTRETASGPIRRSRSHSRWLVRHGRGPSCSIGLRFRCLTKASSLGIPEAGSKRSCYAQSIDRSGDIFDNSAAEGRIALLDTLCDSVGAAIRRGGNASETGVDRAFLIDAPSGPVPTVDLLREHDGSLFGLEGNPHDVVLPAAEMAKLTPPYEHRFGGNALLIPRNFSNIQFVEHPIGYTSSTLGVFYDKPAKHVTQREKQLLWAIGIYLRSRIALYLVATTGRRWLMDRRNIEPTDLAAFPVPFTGLDDPRIDRVLAMDSTELEGHLLEMLSLDNDLERALQEFLDFRMGFQDGDVPEQALTRPNSKTVRRYESVLKRSLDGLIGRPGAFSVASRIDEPAGIGAVAAHYRESRDRPGEEDAPASLCKIALASYESSSANSFSDSLSAAYDRQTSSVTFIKPLEFFRWTVDSAFADGRQMMNAFLAGRP